MGVKIKQRRGGRGTRPTPRCIYVAPVAIAARLQTQRGAQGARPRLSLAFLRAGCRDRGCPRVPAQLRAGEVTPSRPVPPRPLAAVGAGAGSRGFVPALPQPSERSAGTRASGAGSSEPPLDALRGSGAVGQGRSRAPTAPAPAPAPAPCERPQQRDRSDIWWPGTAPPALSPRPLAPSGPRLPPTAPPVPQPPPAPLRAVPSGVTHPGAGDPGVPAPRPHSPRPSCVGCWGPGVPRCVLSRPHSPAGRFWGAPCLLGGCQHPESVGCVQNDEKMVKKW